MNRRSLLISGGVLGISLSSKVLANGSSLAASELSAENECEPNEVLVFIENNHGHELSLSTTNLIRYLRETQAGNEVTLNIHGASRHPHQVVLRHEAVLELLLVGNIDLESSFDVGHTHRVNLALELGE